MAGSSTLRIDGDAFAEGGDGPLRVEYALFDAREMQVGRDPAGRIVEVGYGTVASVARQRLEAIGWTAELALRAAQALRPLIEPYARGAAVRKIAPSLAGRLLLEPGRLEAGRYAGLFLDLAALASDLEQPAASEELQAMYLALLLHELPGQTAVELDTRAALLRVGERSHQKVTLEGLPSLPERLDRLAQRGGGGARGPVLAPARVLELLRARRVAEATLAACRSQLGSVRQVPTEGPLASPGAWEIELLLDAGNHAAATQKLAALERVGRSAATGYLRARVELLTRAESPEALARRVADLAAASPRFVELALLAAEAAQAAGNAAQAAGNAAQAAVHRERAAALFGRGRGSVAPARAFDARSEPEGDLGAPVAQRGAPSSPPTAPRTSSLPPAPAPSRPAPLRPSAPPAIRIDAPATPLDISHTLQRRSDRPRPEGTPQVPRIPPAAVPHDLAGLIGVASPSGLSARLPTPPPEQAKIAPRRRWRGDPGSVADDLSPLRETPNSDPPPELGSASRRSERPGSAPASRPPEAAALGGILAVESQAAEVTSPAALAWGALRPPTAEGAVPFGFALAPLLPIPDPTGEELAEHLPLPLPAGVTTTGVGDEVPRTVLEARLQFTALSRELGRQYRARGVELRAALAGIEQMQAHLFAASHGRPFEGAEVRLHGAFLSEILTRRLGGQWADITPEHLGDWAMALPSGVQVWPFARVARFIERGYRERDLVSYFLELQTRALVAQRGR